MPEITPTGGTPDTTPQPQTDPHPVDLDAFLKEQPAEIVAALEERTKGLKTALDTERETRKAHEKQLRDLAKQAEAGSTAQKQLTEMADAISARDVRVAFYDEAHRLGVADLKLAYLAAQSADLIDARGRVNFDELKKLHPQLFSATPQAPRGHAGVGTGGPAGSKPTMNDYIRRSAGR